VGVASGRRSRLDRGVIRRRPGAREDLRKYRRCRFETPARRALGGGSVDARNPFQRRTTEASRRKTKRRLVDVGLVRPVSFRRSLMPERRKVSDLCSRREAIADRNLLIRGWNLE